MDSWAHPAWALHEQVNTFGPPGVLFGPALICGGSTFLQIQIQRKREHSRSRRMAQASSIGSHGAPPKPPEVTRGATSHI